jgi:hypothetical protein
MRKKAKAESLSEFLKTDTDGRHQCKVCILPPEIRGQVDEGQRSGVKRLAIARWLNKIGYDLSEGVLRRHKAREHANSY